MTMVAKAAFMQTYQHVNHSYVNVAVMLHFTFQSAEIQDFITCRCRHNGDNVALCKYCVN